MGYNATSGERNTTGQPLQTQALSFAGSTAKPHKASMMEELAYSSRKCGYIPHILVSIGQSPTSACHTYPTAGRFQANLTSSDGQSTAHGCCVPGLAVPATDLRSASWYSPSRALSRPEIPLFWFICSKTGSPFGSPKLTKASPAAVAKL